MVVQSSETKKQSSLIELLGGSSKAKSGKPNDAFAQLLSSMDEPVKTGKITAKQADFTALIDPKLPQQMTSSDTAAHPIAKKSAKIAELQTLLEGEGEKNASALLPKELLNVLSNDQVRSLVHRAKEYLKNEIIAKAPEQQIDPKSLPKTLMGLVQLADKMGLNLQTITLTVLNKPDGDPLALPATVQNQLLLNPKALQELRMESSANTLLSANTQPFEAVTQLISEIKAKETKPVKETKKETVSEQPLKSLLQGLDGEKFSTPEIETPKTAKKIKEADPLLAPDTVKISKEAQPADTAALASAPEILKTPKETRTAAPNSDILIGLLQGNIKAKESDLPETESKTGGTESSKSTSLLTAPKADALEVKTKEAAQSMRYFAIDLKEAVENYKPPFTRLTMTLNPEKLGEVEVTLIQRGNNVHVNIQSGNANSVAFLAHNATELKAQLSHQGITNATMNFMSGGENQQQNQNPHQQHNRYKSYQSFEELELSQEALSALEIIIPHYA